MSGKIVRFHPPLKAWYLLFLRREGVDVRTEVLKKLLEFFEDPQKGEVVFAQRFRITGKIRGKEIVDQVVSLAPYVIDGQFVPHKVMGFVVTTAESGDFYLLMSEMSEKTKEMLDVFRRDGAEGLNEPSRGPYNPFGSSKGDGPSMYL